MKKFALAAAFLVASSGVSAAAGDVDLVYNAYTKHLTGTYTNKDKVKKDWVEDFDNDVVGIRVGVTDNFNIGYAEGTNSLGEDSNIYAIEFTHPVHKYWEIGMMLGAADGYDELYSNGWSALGGPLVRAKTPFGGASFGFYGLKAVVLNVEVPLSSSFWRD